MTIELRYDIVALDANGKTKERDLSHSPETVRIM